MYSGIVVQAVLGTFAAAGVTLAAYKFFNIRVTPKFQKVVIIATIAFAVAMLVNFVAVAARLQPRPAGRRHRPGQPAGRRRLPARLPCSRC